MLTLPAAWRDLLGEFRMSERVKLEIATHEEVEGEVCGPVMIQLPGFRPVSGEVLFLDMDSSNGEPEPLLGYIPLEQAGAAVDPLGQRLIHLPHLDMK
jgi:hypothetical protein